MYGESLELLLKPAVGVGVGREGGGKQRVLKTPAAKVLGSLDLVA